jgi:hypothetical protein
MASSSESESDTETSTTDTDERPLRIGLWNPGATEIEAELRDGLPEAELAVVSEDSNPLEVHAVDCLLVDCSGPGTQAATMYETVRDAYPRKPLVVVTRGRSELNGDDLADADRTAHVPRTESGLPIPLVSARCKRVAERALAETDSDEPEEDTGSITRAVGLSLLWGVAVLTYGVGDTITTIVAVYFVKGLGESNPIVAVLLNQFGIQGLFGLKIVVFVVAVGVSISTRTREDPWSYYGPPLFIAVIGTVLTVSNALAIMSA